MSQFYTKAQIDAQGAHMATAINNKIREAVGSISSPLPNRSKFVGTYLSEEALQKGYEVFDPQPGMYAYVDGGADKPTKLYLWDEDTQEFVKSNINPEVISNPSIEEAADITSFTTAFDVALNGSTVLPPEEVIKCIPSASAWSNPISFADVNHPSSIGGVNVTLGDHDFNEGRLISIGNWIDLSNKTTIMEFLEDFANTTDFNPQFFAEIQDLGDGTARFRLVPNENNSEGYADATPEKYFARVGTELLTYDSDNTGTNAEVSLDISTFFNQDIEFITCTLENLLPPPIIMA